MSFRRARVAGEAPPPFAAARRITAATRRISADGSVHDGIHDATHERAGPTARLFRALRSVDGELELAVDHLAGRARVRPAAADEVIGASSAVEHIVARLALNSVVAVASGEVVGVDAAADGVVTGVAELGVGSGVAAQRVV